MDESRKGGSAIKDASPQRRIHRSFLHTGFITAPSIAWSNLAVPSRALMDLPNENGRRQLRVGSRSTTRCNRICAMRFRDRGANFRSTSLGLSFLVFCYGTSIRPDPIIPLGPARIFSRTMTLGCVLESCLSFDALLCDAKCDPRGKSLLFFKSTFSPLLVKRE